MLTPAAHSLAKCGQPLRISAEDAAFVRALDAQKAAGKGIYGCGFLLSGYAAAERMTAERMAAEGLAPVAWELSERERHLAQGLGQKTQ